MSIDALTRDFTQYAAAKLETELRQILRCATLLNDDELWLRGNAHTNSVANLLLHLNGNVRQWIAGGVAQQPVERDRTAEFAADRNHPRERMTTALENTVREAAEIIRGLSASQLKEDRTIQNYPVSVLVAVFHVVEHFSFHTGQIVHITKIIKDVDLSLYNAAGHKLTDFPDLP